MIYSHSCHLQNLLTKNTYKLSITKHTKARQKLLKQRRQILLQIQIFKVSLNSTYGRVRNDSNN